MELRDEHNLTGDELEFHAFPNPCATCGALNTQKWWTSSGPVCDECWLEFEPL
jgi:hypothetical protein